MKHNCRYMNKHCKRRLILHSIVSINGMNTLNLKR